MNIESIILHTLNVKKYFKFALVFFFYMEKKDPTTDILTAAERIPHVEIARCKPLAGSASCSEEDFSSILGGQFLKELVRSDDDRCFLIAVATHFSDRKEEVTHFVKHNLKTTGLKFPLRVSSIDAFDASENVF